MNTDASHLTLINGDSELLCHSNGTLFKQLYTEFVLIIQECRNSVYMLNILEISRHI